jgi:hypothetical protein
MAATMQRSRATVGNMRDTSLGLARSNTVHSSHRRRSLCHPIYCILSNVVLKDEVAAFLTLGDVNPALNAHYALER